jgi:hypothetical protein
MERFLLVVLTIGLSVGQAFGGIYTLDKSVATQFREVALSPGDVGDLGLVIDRNGTTYYTGTWYHPGVYEDVMQGKVGFVGILGDDDHSSLASMRIGGSITPGLYNGFAAYIANDNQSVWQYRLYASDGAAIVANNVWTPLVPGTSASLELTFPEMTVTEIGFEIQLNHGLPGGPSTADAFFTSVVPVPVPGALLLSLLGLGITGLKLRRLT